MAVRALVVAIENYPAVKVGGIAKTLDGTLAAGLAFRDWLVAKWQSEGQTDTQLIFCSDPPQPGGTGATRMTSARRCSNSRNVAKAQRTSSTSSSAGMASRSSTNRAAAPTW